MTNNTPDQLEIVESRATRRAFLQAGGAVIGGVSFAGLLAACGSSDSDSAAGGGASTAAPETAEVDFQLRWTNTVAFAGWYAAQEFGWFKDQGIDLNIIAGGPNLDVQQVVAGGGVPIGEGISDSIIIGRVQQNIPFRVFGALYQHTPAAFMSLAENGWTEPQDMVGKRIATTAAGKPTINALLKSAGLPEDWKFVPSGFDPTPLTEGQADFFQGFATSQGVALELQGTDVNYITYDQFNYDPYDAPIFALQKTIDEQEDLLVRFLRATIMGWEWVAANPEPAAKLTVDKYGTQAKLDLDQQIAENTSQLKFVTDAATDQHGLFVMEPARWDNMQEFLKTAGTLKTTIPGSDLMTQDIQAKAMDGKTQLLSEEERTRAYT